MGEILTKTRGFVNVHQRDIIQGIAMVLIAWSFFNIGRITGGQEHQIRISAAHNKEARDATPERSVPLDTRVVASKNSSSMKYHYSWCGSGRRIKPENQVWFTSAALAEAAGYTLAGNCQ